MQQTTPLNLFIWENCLRKASHRVNVGVFCTYTEAEFMNVQFR
jgi:hypothetical protein